MTNSSDTKRNLTKRGESEKDKCHGDKCHTLNVGLWNQMHDFEMGAAYRNGLKGLADQHQLEPSGTLTQRGQLQPTLNDQTHGTRMMCLAFSSGCHTYRITTSCQGTGWKGWWEDEKLYMQIPSIGPHSELRFREMSPFCLQV